MAQPVQNPEAYETRWVTFDDDDNVIKVWTRGELTERVESAMKHENKREAR